MQQKDDCARDILVLLCITLNNTNISEVDEQ